MSRITTQSLFETSIHKSSWQSYAVSMGVHAGLTVLAFTVVVPVAIEVRKSFTHATLVAPLRKYRPQPETPHLVTPKLVVHEVIPAPVETFVPPPVVLPTVKPQQIVDAPQIKPVQPQPDLKIELPPMPKAPIKTGVFQPTTELAKATPAPQEKVQVGGFGDPHGVQPSDTSRAGQAMLSKVGAFDLPDGSGQSGAGGKAQTGGEIRQTGFGSLGETGRPKASLNSEAVRTTAFGDATLAPPPAAKKNSEPSGNNYTPVEILFKPKPVYTTEARDLRLEGEVALQVVFQANGTIRVVRVEHGLGHGLDEAAQQAAVRVRFKPAMRGGTPVDINATIKISFELT
jgi:TonB family protein